MRACECVGEGVVFVLLSGWVYKSKMVNSVTVEHKDLTIMTDYNRPFCPRYIVYCHTASQNFNKYFSALPCMTPRQPAKGSINVSGRGSLSNSALSYVKSASPPLRYVYITDCTTEKLIANATRIPL